MMLTGVTAHPKLIVVVTPLEAGDAITNAIRAELTRHACDSLIVRGFPILSHFRRRGLPAVGIELELIARCDAVFALALPGWELSPSVLRQLRHAEERAVPITVVDPIALTMRPLLDLSCFSNPATHGPTA